MCGIVGFDFADKELLARMMNSLTHRGPDQRGGIISKKFSLGHRRLSIIDLSERGKQPMCNEEGNIWVVFNGEIYNYKELREDLIEKGHKFKSDSDTEVVIHAYEEYGYECVKYFNGMFAFAIKDGDKLFLARDPVGIKPLYYYHVNGRFIFGSEIKAILEADIKVGVDYDAIDKLLSYRIVPGDQTVFLDIKKLLPGHYMVYEDGKVGIRKYYNIEIGVSNWNEDILGKKFRELFQKSVERRLVADVPVGAFLSGGLDSSCVVGMMKELKHDKVQTFTAGFNEKNDEMHYAKGVAEHFGTEHQEVFIDYEDMTKKFDDIVYHMDEPIADPAIFPVYFVSKLAKEKVKVALFGEGADELFAGYSKYNFLTETNSINKYLTTDRVFMEDKQKYFFQGSDVDFVMKNYFGGNWNLNNGLMFDFKEILPNFQLMKVDKMTMMNSIEGRVPFLDKELVEFSFSIPHELKLNKGTGKYLIRKAMKGIVPDDILFGEKRVFFTPLKKWFDTGLRDFAHERLEWSELFDNRNILKLISKEKSSFRRYKYSNQLWSVLMIESWFKKFIKKEKVVM